MPKENSLPKTSIEEYWRDEDEAAQYGASQRWYREESQDPEIAQEDDRAEANYDRIDEERSRSELYRAGKIDAYLRYLKMKAPAREAEPVTLRRSMAARERPPFRPYDDEERSVQLYGYQRRPIRRPSIRSQRVYSRKPRRNRTKEIAIAACFSLAVAAVTGLIVYDRSSGGVIAETVMAMGSGLWGKASTAPQPVQATEPTAQLADASPGPAQAVQPAAANKKPVVIAELDVEDAAGMASSLIPLSLRADSGVPGQNLGFRLSGLPENAYLTAGTRVSNDAWMLKPGEEQGIKLMVPPNHTGQFAIAVEALEQVTGDLAAPIKEITVNVRPAIATNVEPVAAPASVTRNFNLPPAIPDAVQPPVEVIQPPVEVIQPPVTAIQPPVAAVQPPAQAVQPPAEVIQPPTEAVKSPAEAAAPIPAPIEKTAAVFQPDAAQGLLRSGDKLMSLGDLTAARQFYEKALDEGAPEAALKLGQTYDPAIFAEKNVQGLKPDPSMAMKYYLQAQTAGVADAPEAISGLEAWMQK
jgi:hypothetical protein